MRVRQEQILKIVKNEKDIVESLRASCGKEVAEILAHHKSAHLEETDFFDNPGFLPALKDLRTNISRFSMDKKSGKIVFPDEYIKRLYGTFGLDEEAMERLGAVENVILDIDAFSRCKKELSKEGKMSINSNLVTESYYQQFLHKLASSNLPSTIDSPKYDYKFDSNLNHFVVDPIEAELVGIVLNSELVESVELSKVKSKTDLQLIFDRTNFYYEAGGQDQDIGKFILKTGGELAVTKVESCQNKILHKVEEFRTLKGCVLKIGDEGKLFVDEANRTGNTIHHTSTHLLNSAVHDVLQEIVYQKSSSVTAQGLKLELGVIGSNKIDLKTVSEIDKRINELVGRGCPVETQIIDYDGLQARNDILTIPGEIYPEENLTLLTVNDPKFQSRELCCGTHVRNVSEIGRFCITSVKLVSRGTYQINAIGGKAAERAQLMGAQMQEDVQTIKQDLESGKQKVENLEARVQRLKNMLQQGFNKEFTIPYVIKVQSLEILNAISREIRDVTRDSLKEFIEIEMKAVLDERPIDEYRFIVHNLSSSALMENVRLQKATRLCADRPVLVMCLSGGQIKARACVPAGMVGDDFNAEKWLEVVAGVFGAQIAAPKGQDPLQVCNMKAKKVNMSVVEEQMDVSQQKARDFADRFMI